jgi:hypothetical protein
VNAQDVGISRDNATSILTALKLIHAAGPVVSAATVPAIEQRYLVASAEPAAPPIRSAKPHALSDDARGLDGSVHDAHRISAERQLAHIANDEVLEEATTSPVWLELEGELLELLAQDSA